MFVCTQVEGSYLEEWDHPNNQQSVTVARYEGEDRRSVRYILHYLA